MGLTIDELRDWLGKLEPGYKLHGILCIKG